MDYGTRSARISCQPGFIRTFPGVLKIIEFVCDLVSLILGLAASSSDYIGQKGFFTFVAALAIVITTILLVLTVINVQAVCIPGRWIMIEMYWCAFIALLFCIASIIAATIAKLYALYGAAAFFGFAATITYLIDGLNRFRLLRAGPPGRHTETNTTTTITATNVTRQQPVF